MSSLLNDADVVPTATTGNTGSIEVNTSTLAKTDSFIFDNEVIAGLPKTQPSTQPQGQQKFAGKYVSVEELEKGYSNATDKIRQQAEELKTYKEKYVVPEKYEVENWVKEGVLPENINLKDPELQLGIEAFKKAGLSTEQAKLVLAEYVRGIAKNTLANEEVFKQEIQKFQSEEEYKAVNSKLASFMQNLPQDKQQKFKEMCGYDADSMKLMHDILFPKDKNIPVGNSVVEKESKAKLYSDIQQFKKDNAKGLPIDQSLQKQLDEMWQRFHNAV